MQRRISTKLHPYILTNHRTGLISISSATNIQPNFPAERPHFCLLPIIFFASYSNQIAANPTILRLSDPICISHLFFFIIFTASNRHDHNHECATQPAYHPMCFVYQLNATTRAASHHHFSYTTASHRHFRISHVIPSTTTSSATQYSISPSFQPS